MGVTIPVAIGDLQNGTNTLKITSDSNSTMGSYGPNSLVMSNIELEVNLPDSSTPAPAAGMISCDLMKLMMGVMPGMMMGDDPCGPMPTPSPLPTPTPTPIPAGTWVFCANEGEQCNFSGVVQVRYGANTTYVTRIIGNGTLCSHTIFGDPLFGVAKHCDISSVTTPSLSPTPSPTPTPTPTPTSIPTPSPAGSKPGDINSDGVVNIFDYNILVGNFGKTVTPFTGGDFDGNGLVNIFDYNTLVGNFGK
jgi:hypothetical protein